MNKIQKIGAVLVAVALTAVATQVSAISVTWVASGVNASSVGVVLSDGTTGVPIGGLIAIGNFGTLADPTIADPSAIWANFQAYATGLMGDSTATDGTFEESSGTTGTGFFGEAVYLVVFNAATAASATQVGVFKGPAVGTVADGWTFPASDLAFPKSYTADDLSALSVVIGGFEDSGFDNAWAGANTGAIILANAIPEPSSLALAGVGLLGMISLIRRRRS